MVILFSLGHWFILFRFGPTDYQGCSLHQSNVAGVPSLIRHFKKTIFQASSFLCALPLLFFEPLLLFISFTFTFYIYCSLWVSLCVLTKGKQTLKRPCLCDIISVWSEFVKNHWLTVSYWVTKPIWMCRILVHNKLSWGSEDILHLCKVYSWR